MCGQICNRNKLRQVPVCMKINMKPAFRWRKPYGFYDIGGNEKGIKTIGKTETSQVTFVVSDFEKFFLVVGVVYVE